MAKITYLLGAGASFNSYPILDKQAEMMIEMARLEIQNYNYPPNRKSSLGLILLNKFNDDEKEQLPDDNQYKILWHIGYFGKKAEEYNTIDTYAKKLYLNKDENELRLLKMSVSVFFDLWGDFYESRYKNKIGCNILDEPINKNNHFYQFTKIDKRYKSLFSVLLERKDNKIKLNNDFKFISWNYDLQLEEAYKLFLNEKEALGYDMINEIFKFKESQLKDTINDVFHLNGHHGFSNTETTFTNFDNYWKKNEFLFDSTINDDKDFNNFIKYAWEHDLESVFYEKISNVIKNTEILIIIGYSFPAFNRKIDQKLFSSLDKKKVKKIIYQDPNATKQIIENLFETPSDFNSKIELISDSRNLNQFYLPNEHFITQKQINTNIELR